MFGDVANWCFEHLGGIRFEAGKVVVSPKIPQALDFFDCTHTIPGKGKIEVKWHKNTDGNVDYDVYWNDAIDCKFLPVKMP